MKILSAFLFALFPFFLFAQVDSFLVFYKIGEYELTGEQKAFISEKLEKSDSSLTEISVVGSADFIDDDASNQTLSENRARKVVDFIIEKFHSKFEEISYRGIGEQPTGDMPLDEKNGYSIASHDDRLFKISTEIDS